jgi:2-aminoadipate transaminase
MSLQNRYKVLALGKKYGVPILEDDFAGDLRYDGNALPSLRALPGGSDLVIHQGTFSKALCPGLRVGWLVAPSPIMARLRLAKRSCDLSTNSMSQVILAKYLADGLYQQHLEHVKKSYRCRRDTMIAALEQNLANLENESGEKVFWTKPLGGLFLWVTLPANCSAKELLLFAEREGVTFSPGDLFYCNKTRLNCFRLCFIQQDERAIVEGVFRLARALTTYFESIKKRRPSSLESSRSHRSENILI